MIQIRYEKLSNKLSRVAENSKKIAKLRIKMKDSSHAAIDHWEVLSLVQPIDS